MYKWNKDKIQERIKLLENMKKRNYLEEEALEYLESMINNDFKTFPYEQKDENLLDYLQDMAVIFKEIVVKQKEEKNFRKLDIDMKENDALELVYDFYKEQNEEFFRVFQNIFNTRFDNLEFSFRLSAAIDIPFFNESYINIFKSNDVTLLFDIVHEYAHSIAGQINFDFNAKKSYSLISESGALYFQKKIFGLFN